MPAKAEREAREAKITDTQVLMMPQYRSFNADVVYYHFDIASTGLSFEDFKKKYLHKLPGWNSSNTVSNPMMRFPRPQGDEVPEGFIEVVYLENAFKHGGSALGFQIVTEYEEVEIEEESELAVEDDSDDESDDEAKKKKASRAEIGKHAKARKAAAPQSRTPMASMDPNVQVGDKRKRDDDQDDEKCEQPAKKAKVSEAPKPKKTKVRRPKTTMLHWFFYQVPIADILSKLTKANITSLSSDALITRLTQDALEEAKHPTKRVKKTKAAVANTTPTATASAPVDTVPHDTVSADPAPVTDTTASNTTVPEGAKRPAKRQRKGKTPVTDNTTPPTTSTSTDEPLFDVVATLEKGGKGQNGGGETGHPEHMALFHSVEDTFLDLLAFQLVEWKKAAKLAGKWDGQDDDEDEEQEKAADDDEVLDGEQEEEWEKQAASTVTGVKTEEGEEAEVGEGEDEDEEVKGDEDEGEEDEEEAERRLHRQLKLMFRYARSWRIRQKRSLAEARASGVPLLPEVEELVKNWNPLPEKYKEWPYPEPAFGITTGGKKRKRDEFEDEDEDEDVAIPGPDDAIHSIEVPEEYETVVDRDGDSEMSESESDDEDEDREMTSRRQR
jgi:hypothetical protein